MISKRSVLSYCIEDASAIENYEKAIADPEVVWICHHRKEIDENKSMIQLIEEKLYYMRPASELIFLTPSEHTKLHRKGKTAWNKGKKLGSHTEEWKQKVSEKMKGGNSTSWKKGQEAWNKGKPLSDEQKKKMSESLKGRQAWNKGKPMSEEQKKKISETKKKN